jgi:Zn-dependent protease
MDKNLVHGIQWYVVFLFSTCCHEAAHALVSHRLGDSTAHRGGQVSLDPIPHIRREPMGMVVVPIITAILYKGDWLIGWASAPYDPTWAMRHPKRSGLMSIAGPAANFSLMLIAALLMLVGVKSGSFEIPGLADFRTVVSPTGDPNGVAAFFCQILSVTFSLNLLLGVFNLIPFPPLDGSGIPLLVLNEETARKYYLAVSNPAFRFLGLVVAWRIIYFWFDPIWSTALDLLYRLLGSQ